MVRTLFGMSIGLNSIWFGVRFGPLSIYKLFGMVRTQFNNFYWAKMCESGIFTLPSRQNVFLQFQVRKTYQFKLSKLHIFIIPSQKNGIWTSPNRVNQLLSLFRVGNLNKLNWLRVGILHVKTLFWPYYTIYGHNKYVDTQYNR